MIFKQKCKVTSSESYPAAFLANSLVQKIYVIYDSQQQNIASRSVGKFCSKTNVIDFTAVKNSLYKKYCNTLIILYVQIKDSQVSSKVGQGPLGL